MSKKGYTDTELLDFLQSLNDRAYYSGKCMLDEALGMRAWMLTETRANEGTSDVRRAIVEFIERTGEK